MARNEMERTRSVVEARAKNMLADWFFDLPPGDLLHRIVSELILADGWLLRDERARALRGIFERYAGPRHGETVDDEGKPLRFPQFMIKVPLEPGPVDLENSPGHWGDEIWDDAPGTSMPTDVWVVPALAVSPQGFVGGAEHGPSQMWDAHELADQVFRHRNEDDCWLGDLAETFMSRAQRAVGAPSEQPGSHAPGMSQTDRSVLGPWLLEALESLGGEGTMAEISQQIWLNHEADLRSKGRLFYTWQYDLRWVAQSYKRFRVDRVGESFVWRLSGPVSDPAEQGDEPGTLF